MYRIRFHGRGGQGIKTAGRILGTAFFLEGSRSRMRLAMVPNVGAHPSVPLSPPPAV